MEKKVGDTMKRVFRIDSEAARKYAIASISRMPLEPVMQVVIEKETRKLKQNAAQWPILNAIADQVMWPINGGLTKITGEDFKNILTAAWRKETLRIAQGIDGGIVLLGHRTRDFKVGEWNDWMEFINWFAAEKNVKIPARKKDLEWIE